MTVLTILYNYRVSEHIQGVKIMTTALTVQTDAMVKYAAIHVVNWGEPE